MINSTTKTVETVIAMSLASRGSIEDVVGWPGVLGDMEGLSTGVLGV